jgi:aryl-alcohol dehydrogenase-like predicted oxidoreductase
MRTRAIPSSGEEIPVVGLGTWQQFDVGGSPEVRGRLLQVLRAMTGEGGRVVDTSPMYGRAESVLGDLLPRLERPGEVFVATKVWTRGREDGIRQMEASMERLGRSVMDLIQVHNLVDWRTHLETLQAWKEEGRVRYTGVTHYRDAAHPRLREVVAARDVDVLQVNYSIRSRHAEDELLPAARDRGVAVLVNRPFEGGSLFRLVRGRELPGWAGELGIRTWAQLFLKFVLGHPAVTCVIPGTSDPAHAAENMEAGHGPLPDADTRERMARLVESLA